MSSGHGGDTGAVRLQEASPEDTGRQLFTLEGAALAVFLCGELCYALCHCL